jgi:hypothetical protein
VGIHLNEGESAVRLETRLGDIAKVLEQGDQVRLCSIGGQVADIASRLPLRSLLDNHLVAPDAMGELVMPKRSGGRHSHGGHGLLLGNGGLALLVSPVAADRARAQPLSVHGTERTLGISALTEGDEAIAARPSSLHVPHDTSFGYGTKCAERLQQHLIVDFVAKVAHEDVEVVGRVFLSSVVRLVRPVDADFLPMLVPCSNDFAMSRWMLTMLCTRRPFKVCMARSAAPGSSYSTKP